jgi:hypothetical protein
MPLTPEQFQSIYPKVMGWIDLRLAMHRAQAVAVACTGFRRLPEFFPKAVLTEARYVVVDKVPVPSLAQVGLAAPEFLQFEQMEPAGITYRQTFFVRKGEERRESLFFHELIHVLQWKELGSEEFLRRYADGLAKLGYRNSPLETMAYDAEERFEDGREIFDAVRYVRDQLTGLK